MVVKPLKPAPRRSGASGQHTAPRYLLSLESKEQRKRWEAKARRDGRTLAGWIRRACDVAGEPVMKASEILEVARKQEITSAGVQASVGIAEHTGDFELANKLRALLIILNRAEAESGDI